MKELRDTLSKLKCSRCAECDTDRFWDECESNYDSEDWLCPHEVDQIIQAIKPYVLRKTGNTIFYHGYFPEVRKLEVE